MRSAEGVVTRGPRSYLIAGAAGMLGHALQRVIAERGESFHAPEERTFDITDSACVARVVAEFVEGLASGTSGVLVNAAAYTNVERAEEEPDTAFRVNADGARILAQAAHEAGIDFAHVSTDFVFDGTKAGAYTEQDAPHPLSVYGTSKLAGEEAVVVACPSALIARTAWVFGAHGVNFPQKILGLARERGALSVVTDEVGSPTYTVDLARGIVGLLDVGACGLFHLAGAGSCTRFELAASTLEFAGVDAELTPVAASTFPSKAARPANSVLDCTKAASLGVTMPHWRDALGRYLAESGEHVHQR